MEIISYVCTLRQEEKASVPGQPTKNYITQNDPEIQFKHNQKQKNPIVLKVNKE